jgi:hypothetical protein
VSGGDVRREDDESGDTADDDDCQHGGEKSLQNPVGARR